MGEEKLNKTLFFLIAFKNSKDLRAI